MGPNIKAALWFGGGALLTGVAWALFRKTPTVADQPPPADFLPAGFTGDIGWVRVQYNGQTWDVAPSYIAPVGIAEAEAIAAEHDCELPTPGLVDAIWKAADLKVVPLPRQHDGTPATMASQATFDDQYKRIQAEIGGRPYKLIAGTHKDVVRDPTTGKIGLYGWHMLNGVPIQPPYYHHAGAWIDYSQGVRLVRKAA